MNLYDQEKIFLSHHLSHSGDDFITLKDALIMKEHWPAKYSAYAKKNKLISLRNEFYRRVPEEEVKDLGKRVSFWAKLERCDFTSDDNKLRMLFEKLKLIYEILVKEKDTFLGNLGRGNIKEYIDIEVSGFGLQHRRRSISRRLKI